MDGQINVTKGPLANFSFDFVAIHGLMTTVAPARELLLIALVSSFPKYLSSSPRSEQEHKTWSPSPKGSAPPPPREMFGRYSTTVHLVK